MAREPRELDQIRRVALDRVDLAQRRFRYIVMTAAVLEALLLLLVFYVTDFSDPVHRVVFACTMLVYFMLVMTLFALGTYISKIEARILKAIELAE